MKTTKFLFASTALAAVLLSSACTLIYDSESSDTLDDTSSEISEPVSSDPEESSGDSKESSGNPEESSIDIGVSKPVSSSAEESSAKPEDSKPESSDNSENNSSTSYFNYNLIAVPNTDAQRPDFLTTGSMGFYFTCIRYQQPVFYNTLDDPDLADWDMLGFLKEPIVDIKDPDYFRVKAGDKLESGLTVKRAESLFNRSAGELGLSIVEFDGKLTLEGILYCETYNSRTGDRGNLYFFADAAKSDPIPLVRTEGESFFFDRTDAFVSLDDKFAVYTDGAGIELGLIDEAPIDLSGIISPGECVRAKITISDLFQRFSEYANSVRRATLVSLEKLLD